MQIKTINVSWLLWAFQNPQTTLNISISGRSVRFYQAISIVNTNNINKDNLNDFKVKLSKLFLTQLSIHQHLLWGWQSSGTDAQEGCGVSVSGDIPNPPGHGPVSPAPGDPALAEGWTQRSSEIPSSHNHPVILIPTCNRNKKDFGSQICSTVAFFIYIFIQLNMHITIIVHSPTMWHKCKLIWVLG